MTFVMVLRQSAVFTPVWVDRLARQAAEHLRPTRIVCLSDVPVACERIPLIHGWPSFFCKLEMFRPGLFSGPCVYCDLDSLILGPIPLLGATLSALGKAGTPLAMLDDFFNPKIPASGVMMWLPCAVTEAIYADFLRAPRISSRWSEGDGSIIGAYPHLRLQPLFPGVFGSYKKDKLQAGPKGFAHVSFHGKPKQPDFPAGHWVTKAWLGPNSPSVEPREP